MNYFNEMNTVIDIKTTYRKLCSIHHPDRGGDTGVMQEINAQYHEALQNIDGQVTTDKQNHKHTYHYDHKVEEDLINKINELLSFNMVGTEIMLIGTWIWITGQTKEFKELLKKAHCKWHSKRKCWFFSTQTKSRWNKNASLSDLADSYGHKTFENRQKAIS